MGGGGGGGWEPLRAGACPSRWAGPGWAIRRGSLQGHRRDAGLLLAGEASGLPAFLFGGCRGPPGQRSRPRLEAEGPGTASPGSRWGCSCSAGTGTGAEGWLPGAPPTAADEVPGSSSALDLAGLPEGAGPGARDPPREAAGPGAPAGLPSRPPAARASCQPSRRRASLLGSCTATRARCCTKVAVRFWRETPSVRPGRSVSVPWLVRLAVTVSSPMAASKPLLPKRSSRCRWTQDCRIWKSVGWFRKRFSQFGGWRRLPTGRLGTPAAAHRWGAAG